LPALIGDDPTRVQGRGTMMTLGVLRFAEPPVAAREQRLPALPPSAVAGVEDYVMWALPVSRARLGPVRRPSAAWDAARKLAADLHPALRSVVERAWPEATAVLRGGMIPPMPPWPATAVTVLGDAIHPAPGFGGNLAMRDAQHLRDAIVRAATGEQDLRTAIGGYEDALRRDSFPVAAGSRGSAASA
jgi:2-polyprenyl-6-methoxyphenol hydroxylase-like FAD-dependent oxidoreductase